MIPAYDMQGEGAETVVFLHGVGGGRGVWRRQMEVPTGLRSVAWDMPGYGDSRALPEMTFPALADSLDRLLDALAIRRAHLVGHSMGGMVALEFAVTRPERVASLALVASTAAFGSRDGDWQRSFLAERLAPLDAGRSMRDLAPALVAGMVGTDPDPEGVAVAVATMAAVPEATYRAALNCLIGFDRRSALESLVVPALALAGADDRVAPPEVMERMAARMPQCRFATVPGAGHLVNLERPADFDAALAGFHRDLGLRRQA